ncbi:MAG TPA: DUF503 domain-containing protein [Thermodesulfobacteriota bacterium]|nr:DUF503 domain-containing protein [Thermodesulfobacteriota bacterium]
MVVGICRITLALHDNHSLKGKRQVLKSITEKLRNRFNVSVAEVADNDIWQRAVIGISAVGNDKSFINSVIDKTMNMIDGTHLVEIVDHEVEFMNF